MQLCPDVSHLTEGFATTELREKIGEVGARQARRRSCIEHTTDLAPVLPLELFHSIPTLGEEVEHILRSEKMPETNHYKKDTLLL